MTKFTQFRLKFVNYENGLDVSHPSDFERNIMFGGLSVIVKCQPP